MTLQSRFRSIAIPSAQFVCRALAGRRATRALLNWAYDRLTDSGKADFHWLFTEIFNDQDARLAKGEWRVRFNGKSIRLPLRPEHARLDWTAAISILGHDAGIKATYAALLASHSFDVVFDVGANFGTHSLLFASSGVRTISFEPNRECETYATTAAALNDFDIEWRRIALGDREGEIELVYPKGQTWLGSIASDVSSTLRAQGDVVTDRVKLETIDRHAAALPVGSRILVKIDVEGGELAVLRGAETLLRRTPAPWIFFESNGAKDRASLAELLHGHGYRLYDLPFGSEPRDPPPFGGKTPSPGLSVADFVGSELTNFIAVPAGN